MSGRAGVYITVGGAYTYADSRIEDVESNSPYPPPVREVECGLGRPPLKRGMGENRPPVLWWNDDGSDTVVDRLIRVVYWLSVTSVRPLVEFGLFRGRKVARKV
jgi:hypothetical protein